MKKLIAFGCAVASLLQPHSVNAEELCVELPDTQRELHVCASSNLKDANEALDLTIVRIKRIYVEDSLFIEKLDNSQEKWKASFEADMEMKFPKAGIRGAYGSVYPMCANLVAQKLVQARIKYLNQWVLGDMEGEVCSGSVKPSRIIEKAESAVEEET